MPASLSKYYLGGAKNVEAAEQTSLMSEDTIKVNINELAIKDKKITYKIDHDGSYCFSGNNIRNGVRVPTQIIIEKGVKADVFLEELDIQNVDGYLQGSWAPVEGYIRPSETGTSPFLIKGDVYFHILDNATLSSYMNSNAPVIIEENAQLTIDSDSQDKVLNIFGNADYVNGITLNGTLVINSGTVNVSSEYAGYGIASDNIYLGNLIINGGKVTTTGRYAKAIYSNKVAITGGDNKFNADLEGLRVKEVSISGGNTEINQINRQDWYSNLAIESDEVLDITGGNIKSNFDSFTNEGKLPTKSLQTIKLPTSGKLINSYVTCMEDGNEKATTYGYGCKDVVTDKDGNISVCLPNSGVEYFDAILRDNNGEVKGYKYIPGKNAEEYSAHKVTLKDAQTNEELTNLYANYSGNIELPSGLPYYDYSFTSEGQSFDGTGIDKDIEVQVQKNVHYYKVNYSGAYTGNDEVTYGENVTLPEATKGVYEFKTEDGSEFTGENIKSDVNVIVEQKYKVTYQYEDGTIMQTGYADSEGKITLPEDTSEKKYTYYLGDEVFDGTGVDDNITVTVKDENRSYTVTFDGEYSGTKTGIYGESILPEDTNDEWIYVAEDGSPVTTISRDMTVHVLKGEKDENGVYLNISSAKELQQFRDYVNGGMNKLNGKLMQDIDVTEIESSWNPIGNSETPYNGNFEGQGHKITLNINTETESQALFGYASSCTISNLSTAGKIVTTQKFSAGLIGTVIAGSDVSIKNCSSSIEIEFTPGGDVSAGGMVGFIKENTNTKISDCLYTGMMVNLDGKELSGQGGMVGWSSGSSVSVKNCVVAPKYHKGVSTGENFIRCASKKNIEIINCFYYGTNFFSQQGNLISNDTSNISEIAWKLNTTNGTEGNSEIWTLSDHYPVHADAENKATYRLDFIYDGETYGDPVYTSKDKDNFLKDMTDLEEDGYTFNGWYADDQKITDSTIIQEDLTLTAKFDETLDHAKGCLQNLCNSEIALDNYTTITADNYTQKKSECLSVLEDDTATCDDIKTKIIELKEAKNNLREGNCKITLVSNPENVGMLKGGGMYQNGDEVKLEAKQITGYNFIGWYVNDEIVAKDCVSTYIANSGEVEIEARYESTGNSILTVLPGESFSVNDGEELSGQQTLSFDNGVEITLKADNTDNNFAYWADSNGMIVSRNPEYTFTMGDSITLSSVYYQTTEDQTTVTFMNDSGQVLCSDSYAKEGTIAITLPTPPSKKGYTFKGWSKTEAEIIDALSKNSNIVVTPVYEQNSETYSVKVTYGKITNYTAVDIDGKYQVGTNITVTANEPLEDQFFSHWEDKDGKILSYSPTYFTKVTSDLELTAIFTYDKNSVVKKPTSVITSKEILKVGDVYKLSFTMTRDVPEECTQLSYGFIATSDESVATSDNLFVLGGEGVKKITGASSEKKGVLTVNIKTTVGKTIYVKGYVVYKDKNGNQCTVYSDMDSLNNSVD